MIALLHAADWQIGQVFSQLASGDAAAILEARFKVVEPLRQVSGGLCKTRNFGLLVRNWFVPPSHPRSLGPDGRVTKNV